MITKDRDHAIRIAVSRLSGDARTKAIDAILHSPGRIRSAMANPLGFTTGRKQIYHIHWPMRLTADEYINLRDMARDMNVSMSSLVKNRVFGAPLRKRCKRSHVRTR